MNKANLLLSHRIAVCAALLTLSGCGSGRSGDLEEKLARAEQAAQKAEAAQKEAEKAAEKAIAAGSQSSGRSMSQDPPPVIERDMDSFPREPDAPNDDAGAEGGSQ